MAYNEDDFLMISGIQHFSFCRRQWALIHIEQQWSENWHTMDGKIMHHNAHDAGFREVRKNCIITRGMKVHSTELGISGECDVLEFHLGSSGIPLKTREGLWQPFPVEYKRGKPGNHTEADELQLCAQAMCLEEMLCCEISQGALYYGETRHRQNIEFTDGMRAKVKSYLKEMHQYYERGYTPKVKVSKACNACSLKELCVPAIMKKQTVKHYIQVHLEE